MSPLEAPSWKLYLELRNNFIKFLKNILISYLNTILTRTLKDLVRFLHKDSYKNFQRSCKILVWIFVRSCCGLVLSYKNLTRSCKILVRFWWELFEENDIKGNICKTSWYFPPRVKALLVQGLPDIISLLVKLSFSLIAPVKHKIEKRDKINNRISITFLFIWVC